MRMRNTCSQKVPPVLRCIVLVELEVTLIIVKTDTGGAGLKTCSHGYSTVRFSCTMLDGVHSGVKPEASHVQKCNVAHSESQTPQRGRTRSGAFPLAPGAHCTPFSLSPPNLQYEHKGVPASAPHPPSSRAEQHGARQN